MPKIERALPHQSDHLFLTDGGLETTLIFHQGIDLPHFAAFVLLEYKQGIQALRDYYQSYIDIALKHSAGFILESPTWRANADWGKRLGYDAKKLDTRHEKSIRLMQDLRKDFESDQSEMVISSCVGPRGDGYNADMRMSALKAKEYHAPQVRAAHKFEADLVSAFTITYPEEAIGIVQAAQQENIPAVISFTVETDGRLPSGDSLKEAIEAVDHATDFGPAYFMINCAHPTHFTQSISTHEPWIERIRGIRANASRKSHQELDEADELDDGDPTELGLQYEDLKKYLPNLNTVGGCCGTDDRHVQAVCTALSKLSVQGVR